MTKKYIYKIPYVSNDCGMFVIESNKLLSDETLSDMIYNDEYEVESSGNGETDYEIGDKSVEVKE